MFLKTVRLCIHRISPLDEEAHTNFLQALSAARFDEVLDSIGNYFGFNGLACYSLTFIAVSKCHKGFLHVDTSNTGAGYDTSRAFNIIIPLLLSNDTAPELDVASNVDENMIGRLRYQYHIAAMVRERVIINSIHFRFVSANRFCHFLFCHNSWATKRAIPHPT